MRKIVYDCTNKGITIKTVSTFKEAENWLIENEDNEYTAKMIEIPYLVKTEEIERIEKRKEERLQKIARILQEV